jgi:hypothetical protein
LYPVCLVARISGVLITHFDDLFPTNRGGIGATLGAIGAQLPYPYVHLVYWTIQIVLVALSIETGVILAANTYMKDNGECCAAVYSCVHRNCDSFLCGGLLLSAVY